MAAQVDFYSMLSGLGDTIAGQRKEAARRAAFEGINGPDGSIDFNRAIMGLTQAGDLEGAARIAQLKNAADDRAWRQQEAQRSQQNADRSYNLQERSLNRREIPAGFEANPGGGLRPITGGPADPKYKRTVTDKQNAPAGYKWVDPNDPDAGLAPIPGGPGEKISAEVAARLGLANSFLGQLDDYTDAEGKPQTGLRSRIKAGDVTGLVDGLMGAANIGDPGAIRRKISSGAEALLRNLTGAGMSIEEARKYVARYEPQWNDSSETLLDKVNQLDRELRSVTDVVGKGRGGSIAPPSTARPQGGTPVRINSPAERDALPPGTPYIAPDGKRKIKS